MHAESCSTVLIMQTDSFSLPPRPLLCTTMQTGPN